MKAFQQKVRLACGWCNGSRYLEWFDLTAKNGRRKIPCVACDGTGFEKEKE